MEIVSSLWNWFGANYVQFFQSSFALVIALELIARLTPTKADDGALERIGAFIQKCMDILKIPNVIIKNDP